MPIGSPTRSRPHTGDARTTSTPAISASALAALPHHA
jgi:hypothetical protein